MNATNRATQFSKDLSNELNAKRPALGVKQWVMNWKPKGVEHGGVDVAGLDEADEPIVLVEAELRRQNPVSNVVKIWMWAEKRHLRRPCYVIQAFSKIFSESKIEHRERAKFVGRHMEAAIGPWISYHSMLFDYRPTKRGKVGGGRRRHHARELAALILSASAKYDPHMTNQA